jgi:glycosyltransferase involved in cell wall biosynthesis
MKLVVVSKVRNEGDIIESFCRYALAWCDELLIWDDGSTDNTIAILTRLVEDGLPIHLNVGTDYALEMWNARQKHMIDTLCDTAFRAREADIVVPLDADEFLITLDGESPRTVLEGLDLQKGYRVFWRTYVCDQAPSENARFLPEIYSDYRGPGFVEHYKSILTRTLYLEFSCLLDEGAHNLLCQRDPGAVIDLDDLRIAHYPIRDSYQAIAKVVLFELGQRLEGTQAKDLTSHYRVIYEKFLSTGAFSTSDLREISLQYEQEDSVVRIGEGDACIHGPIDTRFVGEPIRLRYTDYGMREKQFLADLVSGFERLISVAELENRAASERVMESVRYQLGAAIVDGVSSVRGALKLPEQLLRVSRSVWKRPTNRNRI